MRLFLLFLLATTVSLSVGATPKVLILDYHTFLGDSPSEMDYSLQEFSDQLDKIRALGFRFVSLADALNGRIEGAQNIALTIDDGHQSDEAALRHVVFPRKIPVTLFVFPGPLDRSVHYLRLGKLRDLLSDGASLGAHGYFHNYMSATAWSQDPASVLLEARKPQNVLERMTGVRPTCFAYPFGVAAPQAIEAVRAQGYDWAFLANGTITPIDLSDPKLNRWALPRTIVYRSGLKKLLAYLEAASQSGL